MSDIIADNVSEREVQNNNIIDTVAPVLQQATVNENTLVLDYNETLDPLSVPANADFVVLLDGVGTTVSNVTVISQQIRLILQTPAQPLDLVTISYTAGTNPIQDISGNNAVNLVNETVTNNTTDTTAPVIQSSTIDASTLVLTYDENLDATSVPSASDFTVVVETQTLTINSVAIQNNTVTLTLAVAVNQGDTGTISYTSGVNPIRDTSSNNVANLINRALVNNTVGVGPLLQTLEVMTAGFILTYDQNLDEASIPDISDFSAARSTGSITIEETLVYRNQVIVAIIGSISNTDTTATLTYTPNATRAIQDLSGNDAEGFTDQPTTNIADESRPQPSTNSGDGNTIRVTFDRTLRASQVPTADSFWVDNGGSRIIVSSVALDNRDLVLTLSQSLTAGTDIFLWYIPSEPFLQSTAQRRASLLANYQVQNNTVIDTTSPILSGITATADSATSFTWSVSTDEGNGTIYWIASTNSTPPSVTQIKVGQDSTGASANASGSQAVSSTGIQNGSGSGLVSQTAYSWFVMHEDSSTNASIVGSDTFTTLDGVIPVLQTATVDSDSLTLTYNENLDATSVPATSDFTVLLDGVESVVSNVSILNTVVTLTLTTPAAFQDLVTVSYTAGVNPIQDTTGNDAANLVNETVTNSTPAVNPVLSSPLASSSDGINFNWSVSTDTNNGTLYWIVSTSSIAPSVAQIKVGQDSTGASAISSGNQSITVTATQNGSGTGLTAQTSYTFFAYQEDLQANGSNIVNDGFTTPATGALSVAAQNFSFGDGTRANQGAYSFSATSGTIASVGSLTGTDSADFAQPTVSSGNVSLTPATNGSVNKANYSLTLRCYDGAGQTGNFVDVSLTATTFTGRTIAAIGDEGTDEIADIIQLSPVDASGLVVEIRPGNYNTSSAGSLPVGNPGRIRFNDTLKNLTDTLTLRASDINNKPVIQRWTVWNQGGVDGDAGRITFENIHFARDAAEGPPTGSESGLIDFRGAFDAVDLVFRNCLFSSNVGLARLGYTVGSQITAIRLNNVNGVTVEDCEFRNLIDCVIMQGAQNVLIQRNIAHTCYADFLGISQGTKSVTIRDNQFYAFTGDGASLHPDWIQGFTAGGGIGDVEDLNVFGNMTFFTDEGFLMPPVISSSTPHGPVTNLTFADTTAGVYNVPITSEYRNFNFATADGAITAILPDADDPNAVRIGLRKNDASANTLTIQPSSGDVMAGEVDSATSHNAPLGPEWSFTASAGTWTSQRRKRPGVIDFADTNAGEWTVEAIGSTSVLRFDTSGGNIVVRLPSTTDPNAARISIQKFSTDSNTLTVLPDGAETLSGNAKASNQHIMSGAFEAVTWNPGTGTWNGQEVWPTLQGALLQGLADGNAYKRIYFHGNVIYSNAAAGISFEEETFGGTVYRNTLVVPWPGDSNGDGVPNRPADGRPTQAYPQIRLKNRQHNAAESNICGGFSSVDVNEDLYVTTNNFTGLDNTLASYTNVFAGTTESDFNPQTASAVLAPLRPQAGSSIAINTQGALGVTSANDYYNFATRSFTDTSAPTISQNRENAPTNQFIWLEFNKPVKLALTGTITLHLASDNSIIETFDVSTSYGDAANSNGGVAGTVCDGGRRIFIRPTVDLTADTNYYVQFGAGVVKTLQDTDFIGISNTTDWSFTSVAPSPNILPWGAQDLENTTIWDRDDVTVTANASDWTIERGAGASGEIKLFLDTNQADWPGTNLTDGQTYTFAWKAKLGSGGNTRRIRYRQGLAGSPQVNFDLSNGTWSTTNVAFEQNADSTPDAEGFYRYYLSWTQEGTRWRPELLFNMAVGESAVMKEPMLWEGLYSVTGPLPYQDPNGAPEDVTPPALQSATVESTGLVLTYNENLNGSSLPANTDFVVNVESVPVSIDSLIISGVELQITLTSAVNPGEVVTISYTPGLNPIEDVFGNDAAGFSNQTVNNISVDVTAPAITNIVATATGTNTFDWSINTNEANGRIYWIASIPISSPSIAQIKAGQDSSGSPAAASSNQIVTSVGTQSGSGSGLTANTSYTFFVIHEDDAGNTSSLPSDGFTTQSAGGFPTSVTLQFGDNNDGTIYQGLSTPTNEPGIWGSVGAPTALTLGPSSAVPAGGAASDFAISGAGLRCAATPSVGTYSWTGCQFDGSSPTFDLNVVVTANRMYIYPTGTYGEDNFHRWMDRGDATNDGVDLYLRGGLYDIADNKRNESGLANVNFSNRFGNLTTGFTIQSSDPTNRAQITKFQFAPGNGNTVRNVTFRNIHFIGLINSFYGATGQNKLSTTGIVQRISGTLDNIVYDSCLFSSDSGLPRLGAAFRAKWYGIQSGVAGTNCIVRDCEFHDIWVPFDVSGDGHIIERNRTYNLWGDFMQIIVTSNGANNFTVRDNICSDWVSDGAWVHADWIHFVTDNAPNDIEVDVSGHHIYGNVVYMGFEGVRQLPVFDAAFKYYDPPSEFRRTVSANTVLTAADKNFLILFDTITPAANLTCELPLSSSMEGRIIVRHNSLNDGRQVSVSTNGETIQGSTDPVILASSATVVDDMLFYSDGTGNGWIREEWIDGNLDPNYEVITDQNIVLDGSHQDHLIRVICTDGNRVVTAPAVTEYSSTFLVQKFDEGPNTLTIQIAPGDTIDGVDQDWVITRPFQPVVFTRESGSNTNWVTQVFGTTGGTAGVLLQEKTRKFINYHDISIDHNILQLDSLNGVRFEGAAHSTNVWRNTILRPHPGTIRGSTSWGVPLIADDDGSDLSLSSVENICASSGGGFSDNNLDPGTGDDWNELTSIFSGTQENDFFSLTPDEAIDQNLPLATGPAWTNGQKGALGTTRTNGSYDFTNRVYTNGPLTIASVPTIDFDTNDPVYIDFSDPFMFSKTGGTITVKLASDNSIVETFTLPNDLLVAGSSERRVYRRHNRLYIARALVNSWVPGESYYVEVSGIESYDGTAFTITNNTDWTFSSGEARYTTISGTEGFSIQHVMTMPTSYEAGDLVICAMQGRSAAVSATEPGWTVVQNTRISNLHPFVVIAKVMTSSSETAPTITLSGNRNSAHVTTKVRRFAGDISVDLDKSVIVTGLGGSADSSAVTAGWGEGNNLFIWICGNSDAGGEISAPPTGYVNMLQAGGTANIAVAFKEATGVGSDTDDPDAVSIVPDDRFGTMVLALRESVVSNVSLAFGELNNGTSGIYGLSTPSYDPGGWGTTTGTTLTLSAATTVPVGGNSNDFEANSGGVRVSSTSTGPTVGTYVYPAQFDGGPNFEISITVESNTVHVTPVGTYNTDELGPLLNNVDLSGRIIKIRKGAGDIDVDKSGALPLGSPGRIRMIAAGRGFTDFARFESADTNNKAVFTNWSFSNAHTYYHLNDLVFFRAYNEFTSEAPAGNSYYMLQIASDCQHFRLSNLELFTDMLPADEGDLPIYTSNGFPQGFQLFAITCYADDVVIEDCQIHDVQHAIAFSGQRYLIQNNRFYRTQGDGIQNPSMSNAKNHGDWEILGNILMEDPVANGLIIHGDGQHLFTAGGSTGTTVNLTNVLKVGNLVFPGTKGPLQPPVVNGWGLTRAPAQEAEDSGTSFTTNNANGFFWPFDATAGLINKTLPSAADVGNFGKFYLHRLATDLTANAVTILPTGSDTINSISSLTLSAGDYVVLESDGISNWVLYNWEPDYITRYTTNQTWLPYQHTGVKQLDSSLGAVTHTLPNANSVPDGTRFVFQAFDITNGVFVAKQSTDTYSTVDPAVSANLTGDQINFAANWWTITLVSDGISNWDVRKAGGGNQSNLYQSKERSLLIDGWVEAFNVYMTQNSIAGIRLNATDQNFRNFVAANNTVFQPFIGDSNGDGFIDGSDGFGPDQLISIILFGDNSVVATQNVTQDITDLSVTGAFRTDKNLLIGRYGGTSVPAVLTDNFNGTEFRGVTKSQVLSDVTSRANSTVSNENYGAVGTTLNGGNSYEWNWVTNNWAGVSAPIIDAHSLTPNTTGRSFYLEFDRVPRFGAAGITIRERDIPTNIAFSTPNIKTTRGVASGTSGRASYGANKVNGKIRVYFTPESTYNNGLWKDNVAYECVIDAGAFTDLSGLQNTLGQTLNFTPAFVPPSTNVLPLGSHFMYNTEIWSITNKNVISGITQSVPAVVTLQNHGLTTGDEVYISDVSGMTDVNNNLYSVTNIDSNSFSLDGTDSTNYDPYISGGFATGIDNAGGFIFTDTGPGDSYRIDTQNINGFDISQGQNYTFAIKVKSGNVNSNSFTFSNVSGGFVDNTGAGISATYDTNTNTWSASQPGVTFGQETTDNLDGFRRIWIEWNHDILNTNPRFAIQIISGQATGRTHIMKEPMLYEGLFSIDGEQAYEFPDGTVFPVLSLPSATATSQSAFDWSVESTENNGILYWIASTSNNLPSSAQIKSGQDHTGSLAAASGNQPVTTTGLQSGNGSSLSPGTTYTWFVLHRNSTGNESSIVSDNFITQAIDTFPSTVTVRFGDRNGRPANFNVVLEGASNPTTDPAPWNGVGNPTNLALGTSTAVPVGGSATDFVVEGAGIKAAELTGGLTPGTYTWTGCQFDGAGPTFTLNATVEANAVVISPRGTYGEVEFFRFCKWGTSNIAGLTCYLRPGVYEVALNRAIESWPSQVDFNNAFENLSARLTFKALDPNNKPKISYISLGAPSAASDTVIGPLTFDGIDFDCPQDSWANGGSNRGVGFEILDRFGGTCDDMIIENCVFQSYDDIPRNLYLHKFSTNGTSLSGNRMIIRNNVFHDLWNCMYLLGQDTIVENNEAYNIWADFINLDPRSNNVKIYDNVMRDPTCDGAFIHGDFVQVISENADPGGSDCTNIHIKGNTVMMGLEGALNLPVIDFIWNKADKNNTPNLITADAVLDITHQDHLTRANCTTGPITITLPPATTFTGKTAVQKYDNTTNIVTITPAAGDTIDGVSTPIQIDVPFRAARLTSDGVNNWSLSLFSSTNGLQGMLMQEVESVAKPVNYENWTIDHNVLWLTTLAGIRFEGEAYNTAIYRNTVLGNFPVITRPNASVITASITLWGDDNSAAAVANFCRQVGRDNNSSPFSIIEGNETSITGNDWNELTTYLNGTTQTDFEPNTKEEAISQSLAKPAGPLISGGQIGALGTTSANGSYNFDTQSYTTGGLSIVGSNTLAGPEIDALLELDELWMFGSGGTVTIKRQSDNTVIQTYTLPTDRLNKTGGSVYRSGRRIGIKAPQPAGTWPEDFYVEISTGVVEAMDGTAFSIADTTSWAVTVPTGGEPTNLLDVDSQSLLDPQWNVDNLTIVFDVGEDAYSITGSGTNQFFRLDTGAGQSYVGHPANGTSYTWQIDLKRGNADTVQHRWVLGLPSAEIAGVNLATGIPSSSSSVTVTMEDLGAGWYRCRYTFLGSGSRLLIENFKFSAGDTTFARNPRFYVTP